MGIKVKVFGLKDCDACKAVMEKFQVFTKRWGIEEDVEITFYDMDTVDGLTEAALHDAGKVPTTVIEKNGSEVARWDGVVPTSKDFKQYLVEEE